MVAVDYIFDPWCPMRGRIRTEATDPSDPRMAAVHRVPRFTPVGGSLAYLFQWVAQPVALDALANELPNSASCEPVYTRPLVRIEIARINVVAIVG